LYGLSNAMYFFFHLALVWGLFFEG
jgi:hypothetical protein